MVTKPAVHRPSLTVGELRALFEDDHIHMALLVEEGELVGAIERGDVVAATGNGTPAREIASIDGRTIGPDVTLATAFAVMKRLGRRRLAVTTDGSTLLGLLCLKASGRGFCSDEDVTARRRGAVTRSPARR
jgi:CBS domain-containing protein